MTRLAAHHARLSAAVAFLCLIGTWQLAPASANDSTESSNRKALSSYGASAATELAPTEFSERWGGNADYVLTSTGEGVSSGMTLTDDANSMLARQSGNAIDPKNNRSARSDEKSPPKQIGNAVLSDGTSDPLEAAGGCAASPLSPSQIRALVAETARRYQVDEDLAVAVAFAESDFDRSRNSPKGARGPMQLMPETAARLGVADLCDPVANVDGGIRYLRLLLDEFQNPLLAVAAYNAGEDRIYEYGGIPPFAETVGYVAKVVNQQLGLSMPRPLKRRPADGDATLSDTTSEPMERGVIAARKAGAFVGGVMHF